MITAKSTTLDCRQSSCGKCQLWLSEEDFGDVPRTPFRICFQCQICCSRAGRHNSARVQREKGRKVASPGIVHIKGVLDLQFEGQVKNSHRLSAKLLTVRASNCRVMDLHEHLRGTRSDEIRTLRTPTEQRHCIHSLSPSSASLL